MRSSPDTIPGGAAPAARWTPTLLLVGLVTAFHAATVRSGHGYLSGDDFAQYILHARNLVEGRPYTATGYLYNPLNPWFSPEAYPPGFPLLLAPVYAVFGADFRAMKLEVVLFLAGALLLLAALARRVLPPRGVHAAVLLVGLHPYLWAFRDNVLPDVPFLFFCLLALVLAERACDPATPPRRQPAWWAAAGACVAFAVAVRAVGVVLAPALLLRALLRYGRPPRAMAAAGVALLLGGTGLLLVPGDSGYVGQIRDLVSVYGPSALLPRPDRIRRLGFVVVSLWENGYSEAAGRLVGVATALLAALGLASRARRPASPEIFFAGYLLAVFLWPAVLMRYLLPILPLYVLYAVLGAERIARAGGTAGRVGVAVVALAVGASYLARYSTLDFGPVTAGVSGPHARDLYRHIRENTRPGDRFMARRPRALALFTGRAASPPVRHADDGTALEYLRRREIGYVVVQRRPDPSDPGELVLRHPGRFRRVYANPGFLLFQAVPPPSPIP